MKKFLERFLGFSLIFTVLTVTDLEDTKAEATTKWTKFDIRTEPSKDITAHKINTVLKAKGKSSKARNGNIGGHIMKASEKHKINPAVLFSMFAYETGWGSSKLFKSNNNVGGITCMRGYKCTGNWTKFKSVGQSIDKKAQILAGNLYVKSGRTKLGNVLNRYASPSVYKTYSANIGNIMSRNLNQKYKTKYTIMK